MVPPRGTQEHLAVGNINIDVSLVVPRIPGPDESVGASEYWIGLGGAASNYAVAVARLGQKPVLVARTGREAIALGLLDRLRDEGVDISRVVVTWEPTGVVVVILTRGGASRSMIKVRGANRGLSASMVPRRGDVVHLASVAPEIVPDACSAAPLCTYDPGGEALADPEGVARAATSADYLLVNFRELEAITGSPEASSATSLPRGRLKMVVVKYGGRGAALVDSSGVVYEASPPPVRIVDVTGAGDAFDAAFNSWLLWRGDPWEALRAGVAAGAAKVSRRGSSNMPSLEEVESMLARVRSGL